MQVIVLGSGAGGGFPQWNCHCQNCAGLRAGSIQAVARTQSSIALSDEHGKHWVLINASPDIRAQLASTSQLQATDNLRGSPLCAVILVDAQIDHTAGLLFLREGERLPVYCTHSVFEDLTTGFPVLKLLEHYCGVDHQLLSIGSDKLSVPFTLAQLPTLKVTAVVLRGKAPPYSPHRANPQSGDNIGLWIEDLNKRTSLFYAPGLENIEPHVQDFLSASDVIMIDGTFWTEDEMIVQKLGTKKALEMGHLPQSGTQGMIEQLGHLSARRKILIHINNSNPILNEQSEQHKTLRDAGIELAYDGMTVVI